MSIDISIKDLTDGELINKEWSGEGIFDKLIYAVNKNIEGQRQKGYITGEKYGDVYLGSMQSVIAQSMEFLLREKLTEEQIASEKLSQQALKAKTEDENGMIITEDNIMESTSIGTRHHWLVQEAEEVYKKAKEEVLTAAEATEAGKWSNMLSQAKLAQEYNYKPADLSEFTALTIYDQNIPSSTVLSPNWVSTVIPKTKFELEILKARTEASVADKTEKGYAADSAYKIYRSLQELMFALTNSGIIDEDKNDGVYARILDGMEKAMNYQASVWGQNLNIDLDGDNTAEGA